MLTVFGCCDNVGSSASAVCSWGQFWAAGEETDQETGGAQHALRGARTRGTSENHPALLCLQHTGASLLLIFDPEHAGNEMKYGVM